MAIVTIIGAGMMGSALAFPARENGNEVRLVGTPLDREIIETSKLGVYVMVGGRAEFKPLEMITEGSDYYVVKATSTGSKALRAGDEIITDAVGLYDGQLLEF